MSGQRKVGYAIGWSAFDIFFRHGLKFLVFIVLARVLTPEDFGLIAMLALFIALAEMLVNSGFSQALIQRQDATLVDESTIFYFSIAMAAVLATLLAWGAPAIAAFYDQPRLEPLTRWMALNVLVHSFSGIHTTLLTKTLEFRTIALVGAAAALASGALGIAMALTGWGVWSLVGQTLMATTVTTLVMWFAHPWRPSWTFSVASLRSMYSFGGYLLLTGLFNTIYTNLYALMIGKLHSVRDVGLYYQANRLQQLPVQLMTSIVGRVAFPVFSAAAADKARLASGMRRAIGALMFLNAPFMVMLMVLPRPLIVVLFGERWAEAGPVLAVLAIAGLLWPMHAMNINVLKAQGHSALNARLQLFKLGLAIGLLLLCSPYGIQAIAWGQAAASFLAFFVNSHYTRRFLDYGAGAQLRDVLPYMLACVPMAVVMWALERTIAGHAVSALTAAIAVGVSVYLMVCRLAKVGAIEELRSLMRQRRDVDG